jgi:hypothetical protein
MLDGILAAHADRRPRSAQFRIIKFGLGKVTSVPLRPATRKQSLAAGGNQKGRLCLSSPSGLIFLAS